MIKYNKCFYYYRLRKGSICRSGISEQTFCKIEVAKLAEHNLKAQGYTNKKSIDHFRMQSYHDVLYYLLRDGSRLDLIKKHKKLLRKYYWKTVTDNKNSIGMRAKLTMICIAPVTYSRIKNTLIKDPYKESQNEEWFD